LNNFPMDFQAANIKIYHLAHFSTNWSVSKFGIWKA